MTKNSYSKSAVRARMAETGEPYSVAARAIEEEFKQLNPFNGEKADYGELILFTERLSALITAGDSFNTALQSLVQYTEDRVLREGIEFVLLTIPGEKFPDVMRLRPNAFRGIFPEILREERTLAKSMQSLSKLYRVELEMEQRRQRQAQFEKELSRSQQK